MALTGQKLNLKTTKIVSLFLRRYGKWELKSINEMIEFEFHRCYYDHLLFMKGHLLFMKGLYGVYDPYNACG